MFNRFVALLAFAALASAASSPFLSSVLRGDVITADMFHTWMCVDSDTCLDSQRSSFPNLREKFATRATRSISDFLRLEDKDAEKQLPDAVQLLLTAVRKRIRPEMTSTEVLDTVRAMANDFRKSNDEYPYFGFMPLFEGSSLKSGNTVRFSSDCFSNISVSTTVLADEATTTVTTSAPTKLFCGDTLLLSGLGPRVVLLSTESTKTFHWSLKNLSSAHQWFFDTHGVFVYRMPKPLGDLIIDLADTLVMMLGFASAPLSKSNEAASVDFMQKYVEFDKDRMGPKTKARTAGNVVALPMEEHIQSGDPFIVLRMDGLDPMIAWGEGWTSGHSVIAIRHPTFYNNTLHVCESTAKDAYWPRNGIQCTPYKQWISQAEFAEFNVLHAPLSPKYRAAFDTENALNFFRMWEGVNYGYDTFLFGWVDVVKDNFPCVPPHFDRCLDEHMVTDIAILADRLMGNQTTNIFRPAMNHRVNTSGLSVIEVLHYAATQLNMNFSDIYTMPERDSWRYNMSMNDGSVKLAPSMVCCVFTCHMWKAGGVFHEIDADIECGEQTLWDIYSMKLFDANKTGAGRPQVCQTADPTNPLCQLLGSWTFEAKPDFNTRALYKQMGNRCSSLAPKYKREPGC